MPYAHTGNILPYDKNGVLRALNVLDGNIEEHYRMLTVEEVGIHFTMVENIIWTIAIQ